MIILESIGVADRDTILHIKTNNSLILPLLTPFFFFSLLSLSLFPLTFFSLFIPHSFICP